MGSVEHRLSVLLTGANFFRDFFSSAGPKDTQYVHVHLPGGGGPHEGMYTYIYFYLYYLLLWSYHNILLNMKMYTFYVH